MTLRKQRIEVNGEVVEEDEEMLFPGLACGDFGCWPYALMTFDEFLKMKAQGTELQPSPEQSGAS